VIHVVYTHEDIDIAATGVAAPNIWSQTIVVPPMVSTDEQIYANKHEVCTAVGQPSCTEFCDFCVRGNSKIVCNHEKSNKRRAEEEEDASDDDDDEYSNNSSSSSSSSDDDDDYSSSDNDSQMTCKKKKKKRKCRKD
jgi:hypothetical protein